MLDNAALVSVVCPNSLLAQTPSQPRLALASNAIEQRHDVFQIRGSDCGKWTTKNPEGTKKYNKQTVIQPWWADHGGQTQRSSSNDHCVPLTLVAEADGNEMCTSVYHGCPEFWMVDDNEGRKCRCIAHGWFVRKAVS